MCKTTLVWLQTFGPNVVYISRQRNTGIESFQKGISNQLQIHCLFFSFLLLNDVFLILMAKKYVKRNYSILEMWIRKQISWIEKIEHELSSFLSVKNSSVAFIDREFLSFVLQFPPKLWRIDWLTLIQNQFPFLTISSLDNNQVPLC